jgi:hypothetical protein
MKLQIVQRTAETELLDLHIYPDNIYVIRTVGDLSDWVHKKDFPCSTKFVKGLCKIKHNISLQESLPEGVLFLKRWGSTDIVEITFFNGYWLANALKNMILINDRYRTVKCFVTGKKKCFQEKEENKRKDILNIFSQYHAKIKSYCNFPNPAKRVNLSSYADKVRSTGIDLNNRNVSNNGFNHTKSSAPNPEGSPTNDCNLRLLNKLELLEDRIVTLETESVAKKTFDTRIFVLEDKLLALDSLDSRISQLESKLEVLHSSVDKVVEVMTDEFNQVDASLQLWKNDEKFNLVHEKFSLVHENLKNLETKQQSLLAKVDLVNFQLQSLLKVGSSGLSFAATPLQGSKKRAKRSTPVRPNQAPLILSTPTKPSAPLQKPSSTEFISANATKISTPLRNRKVSVNVTSPMFPLPFAGLTLLSSLAVSGNVADDNQISSSLFISSDRESLHHSLPSNDSQDGPLSKDCNSLLNPQPSNENQDGPELDDDDDAPVQCPFVGECPSKKDTYKNLELLRNHLNLKHSLELDRLPKKLLMRFQNLKKSRSICPLCKLLQPYSTLHKCTNGTKTRISELIDIDSSIVEQDTTLSHSFDFHTDIFADVSWEIIANFSVPVMKEVPFNFRLAFNDCWVFVLSWILENPHNLSAWKCLFLLPSLLLRKPLALSLDQENSSLNSQLRFRFSKFKSRNLFSLFSELVSDQENFIPKISGNGGKCSMSRVQWLASQGSASKALASLTSSGIASVNDRSYFLMKQKHPVEEESKELWEMELDENIDCSLPNFSNDLCLSALQDFDRTTGSGNSRINVPLILDCILAEPGEHSTLLGLWSKVLHVLASGEAPKSISSFVSGARLVALEKPKLLSDGLPDLRPIAIGELIRRWVGKILIISSSSKITNYFEPYQLGVGVKCGAEVIYRAVKSRLSSNDQLVLLQVDLTNAFNLCDRATFLRELQHFPSLYKWTRWVYGSQPWLFFGNYLLHSAKGVQQGDPLGPFLFALTLHPIILQIQDLLSKEISSKDFLNLWYLDDGNLVLPLSLVPTVLDILRSPLAQEHGLFLNISKSCIFTNHLKSYPDGFSFYTDDDKELLTFGSVSIPLERDGVRILGIPLGSDTYINSFLDSCLNGNFKSLLDTVKSVDDLHVSFYLWKSCAGFCRVSFLMRCLPASFDICSNFKKLCGDMFSHYFGGHYLSELAFTQASFSPSVGGFGLRYFSEYHVAAYLASLVQCLPFLSSILLPEEVSSLNTEIDLCYKTLLPLACPKTLPVLSELSQVSKLQSVLSQALDQGKLTSILQSDDVSLRDKARLMGCSTKYASAWLACAPNRKKGTHLDDQSLRLLLKYWMGIPIFDGKARCLCGSIIDLYGDHAIHCKRGGHLIRRHDHVRDILYQSLQVASIQVSKELVGYMHGEKSRVGDIILPFGGNGFNTDTECLFDVSILSSLYVDRLNNSSKQRESTSELAVKLKLSARKADRNGMIETARGLRKFVPIGFEALGGFSSNSKKLVDFIATEWCLKSGLKKSLAKRSIVSKISMAIQRGNSRGLAAMASASLHHDLDLVAVKYPDELIDYAEDFT